MKKANGMPIECKYPKYKTSMDNYEYHWKFLFCMSYNDTTGNNGGIRSQLFYYFLWVGTAFLYIILAIWSWHEAGFLFTDMPNSCPGIFMNKNGYHIPIDHETLELLEYDGEKCEISKDYKRD